MRLINWALRVLKGFSVGGLNMRSRTLVAISGEREATI